MPNIAKWERTGAWSRLRLRPLMRLSVAEIGKGEFCVAVLEKSYPDHFPTQAEAEAFAVATLREILEDVMRRLPDA